MACTHMPEACDAIHKFDLIAISIVLSMLDSTIENDTIRIKGFSPEVSRNDNPSNSKSTGLTWIRCKK